MSRRIGYVVVEFNQASGRPGFGIFPEVHDSKEDAETERLSHERYTQAVGRRERYEIASLMVPEDEDGD